MSATKAGAETGHVAEKPDHAGATTAATAAACAEEGLMTRDNLHFLICKFRVVAQERAGWLINLSRFCALLAIVGGVAVVSEFAGAGFGKFLVGVVVAAAGAVEVVYGFSRRAWEWRQVIAHNDGFEARLLALAPEDAEGLLKLRADVINAAAPEEARLWRLEKFAWNAAAIETGRLKPGSADLIPLSLFDRAVRHVVAGKPWLDKTGG